MKKLILIYNPAAGTGNFPDYLDDFMQQFNHKYHIIIHRTRINPDGALDSLLQEVKENQSQFSRLVVAGGDGTLNRVVNCMMEKEIDVPLAIIPAGTVNDFATYLNMPQNFVECFTAIDEGYLQEVDVGKVEGRYFINVCVGGMFSEIAHKTDTAFKKQLGKMAYYLHGIKEFASFESLGVRVTTDREVIEEEIYLFLVLNSQRGGGFDHISPGGKLDDGLFELVLVKADKIYKIVNLLIEVLQKRHFDNENVICTRGNYFKIEITDARSGVKFTDIDGQKGPPFPLEISVIPRALTVIRND
ncbi:MAG: diacylglycerol/lipid kinase family protein [Bacillota bacterium]